MKKNILLGLFLMSCSISVMAQSTAERVYQILQTNCASAYCHSSGGGAGGLDLAGTGSTTAAKLLDVYTNLVGVTPVNATSAAKGDHLVYKGRADKSLLFKKINLGLESTIGLEASEGDPMPKGGTSLTNVEKELIRQWILFGAPMTGEVVKEQLLVDYYDNGLAADAFPNGAPAAPLPSEGFQVKMGPFFLAPQNNAQGWADELEYFQKWELGLSNDLEVTRIDTKMGTYSHHFIMYSFDDQSTANAIPHGLRLNADHTSISLVEAIQEPTDLQLPQGSAFSWENDKILDLNTHYINYDANKVYKAEAYTNIYTQPTGTANQEMFTVLVPNVNIYIPNNGNPYTFTQPVAYNLGEVYLWSMMGHTHKWGTDYDVYLRNPNGSKGTHIYDASCPQGTPGCNTPYFDYQHIPMQFYDDLLPVTFSSLGGIIHEAEYINTGSTPVGWGSTSADEMMVLVFMGMTDTTGVVTNVKRPIENTLAGVKVFPNPATQQAYVMLPEDIQSINFTLYNLLGQEVQTLQNITESQFVVEKGSLQSGIYIYRIENEDGRVKTGKLVFE